MTSLLVLNGPNLNLLGMRQPEIYGSEMLADVSARCIAHGASNGYAVTCFQSNHEGDLVDTIHDAKGTHDGIILNAGAYTHTSIALADAIVGTEIPTIELHISNVYAREAFRHKSYIAPVAVGVICGFGTAGYVLALNAMIGHLGATS